MEETFPQHTETFEFKLTRVLSYLLHPALLPSLTVLLLNTNSEIAGIVLPVHYILYCLFTVILFSLVIPALAVLALKLTHQIKSVEVHDRSERTVLLIISAISYIALVKIAWEMFWPTMLRLMLPGAAAALVAVAIINQFSKISLHTTGWGAFATGLFVLQFFFTDLMPVFLASLLLAGIAGYARLAQHAHTPSQVYAGYAVGAVVMLINCAVVLHLMA